MAREHGQRARAVVHLLGSMCEFHDSDLSAWQKRKEEALRLPRGGVLALFWGDSGAIWGGLYRF
jgi:hypothetical protein